MCFHFPAVKCELENRSRCNYLKTVMSHTLWSFWGKGTKRASDSHSEALIYGFPWEAQEPWMQSTAVIFWGKSAESNQHNTKKGKGRKAPTSRICPHDKTPTGSKDQHQKVEELWPCIAQEGEQSTSFVQQLPADARSKMGDTWGKACVSPGREMN